MSRFEVNLAVVFTGIGLLLRFLFLDSRPGGFDTDESFILYWGEKLLRQNEFHVFAPEFTQWEMLPGYLYAVFSAWGQTWLRAVPVVLNVLEAGLLWLVVKQHSGRRQAWVATALYSTCPWSFYYSRILGTCTGVGIFALLAFWRPVTSRTWLVLTHTMGLLYYTTYRLVVFFSFCLAVTRRQRGPGAVALLAGGLAMTVVAFSQSEWMDFFTRGRYNVLGFSQAGLHYLYTLVSPLVPVLPPYRHTTETFMADYVHAGFTTALGAHTPLGFGFSLLLGYAAFSLCRAKWRGAKVDGVWDFALFLGVSFVFLGFMGPSFSRLLILVPFFAMLSAWAWRGAVPFRAPATRSALLAVILLSGTVGQLHVLAQLGETAKMEPYFHARFRQLAEYMKVQPGASAENTFLLSDYGYPAARYWATVTDSYTVLPAVTGDTLRSVLGFGKSGVTQYLLVDEVPAEAAFLSGFDKVSRIEQARRQLLEFVFLEEAREIRVSGKKVGEMWKIRWPS